MPFRQVAVMKFFAHGVRQTQKTQLVGDGWLLFSYPDCHGFLGQVKRINQFFIAFCLFQIVQILTLQIFNQGNFRYLLAGIFAYYNRNGAQPGHGGCPQPSFTGNKNIRIALSRSHQKGQERLQYTVLADGICQFRQGFRFKLLARLVRIWHDFGKRNLKNLNVRSFLQIICFQCFNIQIVESVLHKISPLSLQ